MWFCRNVKLALCSFSGPDSFMFVDSMSGSKRQPTLVTTLMQSSSVLICSGRVPDGQLAELKQPSQGLEAWLAKSSREEKRMQRGSLYASLFPRERLRPLPKASDDKFHRCKRSVQAPSRYSQILWNTLEYPKISQDIPRYPKILWDTLGGAGQQRVSERAAGESKQQTAMQQEATGQPVVDLTAPDTDDESPSSSLRTGLLVVSSAYSDDTRRYRARCATRLTRARLYVQRLAECKAALEQLYSGSHPDLLRELALLLRERDYAVRQAEMVRDYRLECTHSIYQLEINATLAEYKVPGRCPLVYCLDNPHTRWHLRR